MKRSAQLIAAGIPMIAVGFFLFSRAEGGTDFATVAPFLLMIAGIIVTLAGFQVQRGETTRVEWAGLLEPGAGWSLAGDQKFRLDRPGTSLTLRFIDAVYDKGRQVAPPRTELIFGFPDPFGVKLELREKTSFLQTDIRDVFAGLKPVEAVTLGELHVIGAPQDRAAELAARLKGQGFETWQSAVRRDCDLKLIRGRLAGGTFELVFDGWLDELSIDDDKKTLKGLADELIGGPLSWR